jgi:hypothetical protein
MYFSFVILSHIVSLLAFLEHVHVALAHIDIILLSQTLRVKNYKIH